MEFLISGSYRYPQQYPFWKVAATGRCRICGGGRFSRVPLISWDWGYLGCPLPRRQWTDSETRRRDP